MAMRHIDPSAALRKPGVSRKYFALQWRMFVAFGLSDQPVYSSRLACGSTLEFAVCEGDRANLPVWQFPGFGPREECRLIVECFKE